MPPILLQKDNEAAQRLERLRDARTYFQHHLGDLRKMGVRYVLLCGEKVVVTGDDPDDVRATAQQQHVPLNECLLAHIPQKGESYFF